MIPYKYFRFLIIPATIVYLLSCSKSDEGAEGQHYRLVKVDSVVVKKIGRIEIVDFNEKRGRFLMVDNSKNVIFETNRKGEVLKEFDLAGDGNDDFGTIITNISYCADSAFVVASPKGYFVYSLEGNLLKNFIDKSDPSGGNARRIRVVKNSDEYDFISLRKSTVPENLSLFYRNSRDYYNSYKALTCFSSRSGTSVQRFPYADNSIFKKFDYYYGDRNTIFETSKKGDEIYLLNSPEPVIRAYGNDSLYGLRRTIELKPENFKTAVKAVFDSKDALDLDKALTVNSGYNSLLTYGDYILTVYSTGIPEDIYESIKSSTEIGDLRARFDKRYVQLFKNGKKIGGDILMPDESYSASVMLSPDSIVTNPFGLLVERPNYSVFFVYKLVQL